MKTYKLGDKVIQAEEWRYEAQFKALGYEPVKAEEPKQEKVEIKAEKKDGKKSTK